MKKVKIRFQTISREGSLWIPSSLYDAALREKKEAKSWKHYQTSDTLLFLPEFQKLEKHICKRANLGEKKILLIERLNFYSNPLIL